MGEASLYERLGGVFAIAAVVDHFSDAVIANPKVGRGSANPQLDDWSTRQQTPAAGTQVHADAVGVQRGRRAVRVRRLRIRETRPSDWKTPIATCGSVRRSSTRWRRS